MFNRDFLKNFKPGRLIETVRLLLIYVKVGLFSGKMTEYLVTCLIQSDVSYKNRLQL